MKQNVMKTNYIYTELGRQKIKLQEQLYVIKAKDASFHV